MLLLVFKRRGTGVREQGRMLSLTLQGVWEQQDFLTCVPDLGVGTPEFQEVWKCLAADELQISDQCSPHTRRLFLLGGLKGMWTSLNYLCSEPTGHPRSSECVGSLDFGHVYL